MKENESYKKNRNLPPKSVLLEKAFDNTQVAIAVTDLNQKIELINPEFTRMFGYSEEEAIGKDIVDLIIPEAEINKVVKVKDKLDAGERIEYESVRRTSDGRMIPVFARISPIVVDGVKVGGSSFYTDISKRKRAQEELLKAHEELEEKVRQRTRELSESEKR
jgi:PAS domain S-box-containing protein